MTPEANDKLRAFGASLDEVIPTASREDLFAIVGALEGRLAEVRERLSDLRTAATAAAAVPPGPEWLTPREAADVMRVSVKWLSRRKYTLSFIKPLDTRGFRVNAPGMQSYLETRR
jgi:hypothetical protein